MAPRRDLYKILQVDPEAEPEVIQAAYRRLARKYHPDVADPSAAAQAAARMAEINEAWAVLGDTQRRTAYDADRAAAGWDSLGGRDQWSGRSTARNSARSPGSERWTQGPARAREAPSSAGATASTGDGSAGPPPGSPSGSVLNFGRYAGWSLGEIARHDPDFLERLDRLPIGRRYREEIDQLLRRLGRRGSPSRDIGGIFRRR